MADDPTTTDVIEEVSGRHTDEDIGTELDEQIAYDKANPDPGFGFLEEVDDKAPKPDKPDAKTEETPKADPLKPEDAKADPPKPDATEDAAPDPILDLSGKPIDFPPDTPEAAKEIVRAAVAETHIAQGRMDRVINAANAQNEKLQAQISTQQAVPAPPVAPTEERLVKDPETGELRPHTQKLFDALGSDDPKQLQKAMDDWDSSRDTTKTDEMASEMAELKIQLSEVGAVERVDNYMASRFQQENLGDERLGVNTVDFKEFAQEFGDICEERMKNANYRKADVEENMGLIWECAQKNVNDRMRQRQLQAAPAVGSAETNSSDAKDPATAGEKQSENVVPATPIVLAVPAQGLRSGSEARSNEPGSAAYDGTSEFEDAVYGGPIS